MTTISIHRLEALPSELAPSTIYIIKSQVDFVDLYFTNSTGKEIRRALNIVDVNSEITRVLETWVPEYSKTAGKLKTPVPINLTGDVTEQALFSGDQPVTIITKVVNGGGGGGAPANIIEYGMFLPLDSSGCSTDTEVFLTKPDAAWPNNKGRYSLVAGDLIRVKGVFLGQGYHAWEYFDGHRAWDVSATIKIDRQGVAFIVDQEVVPLGVKDEEHNFPWELQVLVTDQYIPTPEELDEGFQPSNAAFWIQFNPIDYRRLGNNQPKIMGRLEYWLTNMADTYPREGG